MELFVTLKGANRRDFLDSKYKYYRKFNLCVVIVACLSSISYFVSDCQLFGRFAQETLLPRTFILVPLTIFLILYYFCKNYQIMSILSLLTGHAIMWCTIWAIYYLPDKTHASEGFIIMQLVFFALSYSAPFAYATMFHSIIIVNILVSDLFNHYDNLSIMLSLGLPCLIGCIAVNFVMNQVYYDTYTAKKKIEASLVVDPLTGVYNRNILSNITKDNRFSFVRSNIISILMIDVDHFKQVNDKYGHDKGDQVLKSVTNSIQTCTRGEDYTIRWGGEEFIVVMPNCPLNNAVIVAERIRKHVLSTNNNICPTTVSIGVAAYDNINVDTSIINADKALYVAKQTGRNRVEHYMQGGTTEILTKVRGQSLDENEETE